MNPKVKYLNLQLYSNHSMSIWHSFTNSMILLLAPIASWTNQVLPCLIFLKWNISASLRLIHENRGFLKNFEVLKIFPKFRDFLIFRKFWKFWVFENFPEKPGSLKWHRQSIMLFIWALRENYSALRASPRCPNACSAHAHLHSLLELSWPI